MARTKRSPERDLYDDLIAFHSLVDGTDLERLAEISTPELRASTWDAGCEAAWGLLRARMTAPVVGANDDDDDTMEAAVAFGPNPEILMTLLPPLHRFLRYLERFPEGEARRAYRSERVAGAKRWYPHVHPSKRMLDAYLRKSPAVDPAPLDAAVEAHILGPYHCLSCLRELDSLSASRGPGALAAATHDDASTSWRTHLLGRTFTVSCVNNDGYLLIFLSLNDWAAMLRVGVRASLLFESGAALTGIITYPDHSLIGVNLGKLGPRGLLDLAGCDLEVLLDESS